MVEVKIEPMGSSIAGKQNAVVSIDGIVSIVRNVKIPNSATKKRRDYLLIAEAFKMQSKDKK